MKYYQMTTDEQNKCPYNINSNQAVDVRLLTKENLHNLPAWNVVGMSFPSEGFFPDLLCSPWIMVSKRCLKAVMMYQRDIRFAGMKLFDKSRGINATYFFILLDTVDCLSDKSEYNSLGNRLIHPVLDKEKIRAKVLFQVKGYDRKYVVGRMDFVESLLRRGAAGIWMEEIDVV